MSEELIQGSNEWRLARCGSLGASQIALAMTRTKSGWGASRANVMADLLVERLTGVPTASFQSPAMIWGNEHEAEARAAYSFRVDKSVDEVGLVRHPTIFGSHASPDGFVGESGLVEIKCPQSATHIDTLLGDPIDGKYIAQMQWQMACTGRRYCDWVSYDPRLPESMRLFIKRVMRDDAMIAELEKNVRLFLDELAAKVDALKAKYGERGSSVNKLAAIQAQLVDVRNVGQHKCVKLTIHVPAEQAGLVMAAFGWPTYVDPVPVAIARLDPSKIAAPLLPEASAREAESSKAAPPASASQLTTRAVMLAKEPLFRRFVELETNAPMGEVTEETATEYIRSTCQVESRSEIRPGTAAGDRFCFILSAYVCWKEKDRYVAA